MRISDWSSDVCSSDLADGHPVSGVVRAETDLERLGQHADRTLRDRCARTARGHGSGRGASARAARGLPLGRRIFRSEEHTSALQSLMRTSYAVFCWKKQKT